MSWQVKALIVVLALVLGWLQARRLQRFHDEAGS